MGTHQVQPAKQLATQFKSMQKDVRNLRQKAAKSATMGYTPLTSQLVGGWTEITSYTFFFEIEPGGNFVYLDGRLKVPSSGITNPFQFASLGNATECIPVRNEWMTANHQTSANAITAVAILVDTSGALWVYGTVTANSTLNISARYPLKAAPM